MFKFTSTVILNSNIDSSGVAKWSSQPKEGDKPASFNVKRVNNYIADFVKAIFKREASKPELAKAEFKIDLTPGNYRLALYIRLSGSQMSYYANDLVYKGKPLYFEFEVKTGETATEIAKKIAKGVKSFQNRYDIKYIDVVNEAEKLTLTGTNEYQVFKYAAIEKFEVLTPTCDCGDCRCDFVKVIEALPEDANGEFPDADNKITQAKEGFGTYTHITKDLRLPTMAALNYTAVNSEERPILGALYNQYTLYYVKERGILGSDAVGDMVTSATAHVFYVNQSVAAEFEAALSAVGEIKTVGEVVEPTPEPDPVP